MGIEVISNTNLFKKDVKEYMIVWKIDEEPHRSVMIINNSCRFSCCAKYSTNSNKFKDIIASF